MKNNLKSTFHTKISLKAIKPEENIFEIFPTEKTKRKMSKNKYFSPEFSRDISINNSQNNIKEILNEFKYSEKENLPSIISSPITNKYLTDFHKSKLSKPINNISNVNYLYFPNNLQKKIYNDISLVKFFNSDFTRNEKEINQELFNKLIYFDSLSKRIGKKERNLICDYIKNKIKVKNCIIVPPECVHNKFVKLLLLNINNHIENKLKKSGNISNEYINNLVKSQMDNLKYKIKQGIMKYKNIVNNELNNTSNNFNNKIYRTIRLKHKPNHNANLTSSIQFLKDPNKLLNFNNDNHSNYFSDNEDYIQEQKQTFYLGNYNECYQETDSDKISLNSIVNNKDNKYLSKEQKKSKMKVKYSTEEISVTIEYYDEEGNLIENNDNKPLILYDENGNQIFDYKLKKDMRYFNSEGKQIFISIKNNNSKNNYINSSIKNHHLLDKLVDKKKNFSQNNLNEKTINSSKYSNNNSIEQFSHENDSFNKKDWEKKIMKKIFNKDKQYDNNIIDTQIYENNNSYSKSDIEEKKNDKIEENKINISESRNNLKRNNKISLNILNSTKNKNFIKSQYNIIKRNDALKKNNILKRGIKTSSITKKFLSKYKKKNQGKNKKENENEKIEENINSNDDIIDSNNDEKKLSKRFLTQSTSRKSIKLLKKEEDEIEKKKNEKEEYEEQKQKYEEEVKIIIHNDIIKNLTIQKKVKSKADPKIIKLLQEKERIHKLGLSTYELYEDKENENDKKNTISNEDEKNNKNNNFNSHKYNYSKVGNENFIIYKGKDYFNDKKNNNFDQNLKNEYSSWVKNEIKKKEDNINQKYSLIKSENEIKINEKIENNNQNNNLNMTSYKKTNKRKIDDDDENENDFERKKIIRKQYLKTPLNTKKIIKLNTLRNKFDNTIKDNEDDLPLSIKKPSSRSNDENQNDNKYSMNKLLSKIRKLKNLSQEEYDKELFSLVDKQIENIEIAKNRNKAERINIFIDRLNYLRQTNMNYHKIQSEKLIYKEPLNIRSFSDEKVNSKQNKMKGNLIENIKK